MLKSFNHYRSGNEIYFHHSITKSNDGKNMSLDPESHPLIEVLLLLSGKIDYSIDGKTYSLEHGDMVIVNSFELHSLKYNPHCPCERLVLQFSPSFIPKLNELDLTFPFKNSHLYQHIIPKKIVSATNIEKILRMLKPVVSLNSKYKDAKIISLIVDLVTEINIAVENLLTVDKHMIPSPKSKNELLFKIIDYINQNIKKNISMAEISSDLGISQSYLHRFFNSKMGLSIHKYIQNQKMQVALSLINNGESPNNVSSILGYDYYATFFSNFIKTFNITPSQASKNLPPRYKSKNDKHFDM